MLPCVRLIHYIHFLYSEQLSTNLPATVWWLYSFALFKQIRQVKQMYPRNICFKNGFIVFSLSIRSKDVTEIEFFTDYATRFLLSSGGNIDTLSMSTWSPKTQRACQPPRKLRRPCYTIWLPDTTKTLTRHFINLKLFSVHDFNIIMIACFRQTKPSYQLV